MGMLDWLGLKGKKLKPGTIIPTGGIRPMSDSEANVPTKIRRFESKSGALTPDQRAEFGINPRVPLRSYAQKIPSLANNLVMDWTHAVNTRREYLNAINEMDTYYLVGRLIEAMTEDVLNPNERGEVIEVASNNPKIKQVLDDFIKLHDLNNFVCDITPDLFRYGDVVVRLEVDEDRKNGVQSINNDLNPLGVVALYEKGQPSNFLVLMEGQYVMMPAYQYAHFFIGDDKKRVKIDNSLDPDYQIDYDKIPDDIKEKIPDYVRIGRPFFYGVLQKIRELVILEQILVALKLNQITQSKLIALQVPPGTPTKKVREQLDDIEGILNSEVAIDIENNQITAVDLLSSAGRFKVVPNFGDGKGHIEALNIRDEAAVDDLLKSANDMRKLIMSGIGVPYTLIFEDSANANSGQGGDKAKISELRRFGKYARKLSSVQRCLSKGVKQILLTHLVNYNNNEFNATADDFDLVFINQMVDLSGIEKLEYDDIKQEMFLKKMDLADRLLESPITSKRVKVDNLLEWLNETLTDITNGIPLLDIEDEENEEQTSDELRDEFLSVAKDNFVKALTRKDAPVLTVGTQEEQEQADAVAQKADQFVLRVKSMFAKNRAKKGKPVASKVPLKNLSLTQLKTVKIGSSAAELFQQKRKQHH